MADKVDVLVSVMVTEALRAFHAEGPFAAGTEFERVSMAKALEAAGALELIEAAQIGRFYLADVASDPFHTDQEKARLDLQQVDAALARIGGA